MKKKIALGVAVALAAAAGLAAVVIPAQAASGFYVSNGRLYDANGSDFVMRGVNHPYIWFTGNNRSFADIKATGANTVRVVLDNNASTSTVATAVTQCKNNKLVCVLETHTTTGWPNSGGSVTLDQAANWWLGVKSAVIGQERYVIVNLGNEPFNSSTDYAWVTQTKNAISKLRNGGITNTLMADGPGWGQDPDYLMRNNAWDIFNSDPQRNLVFSVHMYGVYGSSSRITDYINWFPDNGLPLVVGEFGPQHSGVNIPVQTILNTAQSRGVGWLAWSWSGNGGADYVLDMTNNFNAGSLTSWGNTVVWGTNGLKQASKEASVYGSSGGGSTGGGSTGGATTGGGSSGSGTLLKAAHAGKCLDVPNKSTTNGTAPVIWGCNGGGNQGWTLTSSRELRVYGNKCLDVIGQGTANGATVAIWDCNGQSNQQWTLGSNGSVKGVQSGRCLDVSGRATADGSKVVLWDCNGQTNQQWSRS